MGLFQDLKKLEILDLRYNKLSCLAPSTFEGLCSLEWLFLGSNSLESIALKELSLNVPHLEWLQLSNNLLTLIGLSFPRMQFLYEL